MSMKHEFAIRDLQKRVEALESLIKTLHRGPEVYEALHRGWGRFSVIGPEGEVAKGLSKDEAEAKAAHLNAH